MSEHQDKWWIAKPVWWLLGYRKKIGPLSNEQINHAVESGSFNAETLIWRSGFESWAKIGDHKNFADALSRVPPKMPELSYEVEESNIHWLAICRLMARFIDIWLESLLVGYCLVYPMVLLSDRFANWIITNSASEMIIGIICFPIIMILDAVIFSLFGNTLGKYILKFKVVSADGYPLSFKQYLHRNYMIWVQGFVFSLPIIFLISIAYQYVRLVRGLTTSYDIDLYSKEKKWKVIGGSLSPIRKIIAVISFLLVFLLTICIVSISKERNSRDEVEYNPYLKMVEEDIAAKEKDYRLPANADRQRYERKSEIIKSTKNDYVLGSWVMVIDDINTRALLAGNMSITASSPTSYKIDLYVRSERCVGEFAGFGAINNRSITFYNNDNISCQLTISMDKSERFVTVRENESCSTYHGVMCNFNGKYVKLNK